MSEPEAPALVPWEDASRGLASRVLGTLLDVFRPTLAAPALAQGGLRPALAFALLTTLPFIAVFATVEYTHTLSVAPGFVVQVLGHASSGLIARDVALACSLGVAIELGELLLLAAPFITLTPMLLVGAVGIYDAETGDHVRHGPEPVRYLRRLGVHGHSFELRIDSRGVRTELVPPVPMQVLAGDVHGRAQSAPEGMRPLPSALAARARAASAAAEQ